MYEIDTSSVAGALEAFGTLALGALGLREAAFETVDQDAAARDVARVIVFVAGASQLLGQSVALFLNGVRPWRFVLSMLLAAVVFAAGVTVWILAVWAASALLVDQELPLARAAAVVTLGHAPYLLSFLLLLPYYGPGLERVLSLWSVACVAVGLRVAADFSLPETALAIGVGFLFVLAARLLVGRWVERGTDWLRRTTAGSRTRLTVEGAFESFADQARRDARWWLER